MLQGLRILVTQADVFMGPALCQTLQSHGAVVLADTSSLTEPDAASALVKQHGQIDVLLVNLAVPAPSTPAAEVEEAEWQRLFNTMVHPMQRLVKAVLPQMLSRKRGKIIVMGSASALRGMKRSSSYSAARGAQLAYVQAVGVELAPHGIQVNAIAQNFVDNPTYFPPQLQADPRFIERLKREVPLGRLVKPEEDAEFVAYLCSSHADCFVGQVFPVSGGWAVR
jgi:2-keto-3-deoxy-L-fuconate dehydrogenase